ncbi:MULTISPECIES: hypothetical protein [unclassified Anaerobiospirillum]|uniref:tetratricopeptide repeat protein n=1 Tax=unclassified Anaerobiospirillum TaxID=2647410 RepID=UPI001FF2DADA|nr:MULTISPECIES: hypothetical protein [unclassified Anaerobiospirillum]MCK0535890.1 hypothetical protein [Anaerobiospirillum sp. NML120511]MCK0541081.1 hypothetical protein [Anaerobiospirillum sp. NML02-A-032]
MANKFFSAPELLKGLTALGCAALLSLSFNTQAAESFKGQKAAIEQCEAGKVESCNYLAQYYLDNKNYAEAAKYLSRICYSDSPDALRTCAALTTMLTDSNFGINDYASGIKIGDYLCSKNDPYGCLLLSNAFFIGNHVEQDLVRASKYAQRACDLKDPVGCRQLAVITFSEAYVLKDVKVAQLSFKYHKDACDLGNQDSCADYAEFDDKMDQFQRYVQAESAKQGVPQQ